MRHNRSAQNRLRFRGKGLHVGVWDVGRGKSTETVAEIEVLQKGHFEHPLSASEKKEKKEQ